MRILFRAFWDDHQVPPWLRVWALQPGCQHLSPDSSTYQLHDLGKHLLVSLYLSSSSVKQGSKWHYLMSLNELISVWHLESCLVFDKYSVNVSFQDHHIILIRLETLFQKPIVCKPHFTQITNRMFREDYPSLPLSKEGDASLLHLPSAIAIALELAKCSFCMSSFSIYILQNQSKSLFDVNIFQNTNSIHCTNSFHLNKIGFYYWHSHVLFNSLKCEFSQISPGLAFTFY